MKRKILPLFAAALALLLALAACASNTYTLVYYENESLMENSLDFDMKNIPGLDNAISYAASDGKLGEITYAVSDSVKGESTVVLRMSNTDYAEKYSRESGCVGISSLTADTALDEERLGSATVKYYKSGSTVFAVWTLGEYAYSASVTFRDASYFAGHDDLYDYVLAVIST